MTYAPRFAFLLVVLVGLTAPAHGQIYVHTDATGANDGSSWADAYTDLQTAIDNASGSDELWIAESVYTPDSEGDSFTITGAKDGIALYGGFDGTESSRDQRAPEQHRTILSGDLNGDDTDPDGDGIIEDAADIAGDENAHHVVFLDGASGGTITPSTVIDGITVTAGDADGSFPENSGGGLLCDGEGSGNECSPSLRNIAFVGNRAGGDGGGIYNIGANGGVSSPRIADARFSGNVSGDAGGAIANKGFSSGASSPTITNTVFSNNTAANGGGAIFNSTASPTMINVVFVDNAADSFGGAILNSPGSPSITNAVFAGNAAAFDGGAIYNEGIDFPVRPANPKITNATFTDNTAGQEGGAIYNYGDVAPASPSLTNTILWGNSAATAGDEMYSTESEAAPILSHMIIEDGVGGIVDENGASTTYLDDSDNSVSFANSTNLDADPQFVDAANPAGPDGVVATRDDGTAIGAGSPAIEGGDTNALPGDVADLDDDGDTSKPLPVDLTGAARLQDRDLDGTATVDIGAYELETQAVAITGGGFGGLDRTFSATPGQADQPIGLVRLTPIPSGVDLTEVAVTPDAPGATGVDGASLWISDDDQFDASGDTELASLDLDPQTDLPSPLTFGGFSEGLPAEARYLFVTVTLTDDASGEVTGYLASETALSLSGGAITEVNGNSQDGFSNLPLSGDASTLPVEMASFEGTTTDGGVRLRWQTASEQNNTGFRVLRTGAGESGGVGEWTEVGFVEGAGTTSEGRSYRFTDDDLPYEADTLAYRLKQVDTDGSTSLTEPVTVARSGPEQVELLGTAPNPVRQRTTVRYAVPEGTGGDVTLRLYDVLGRRVRTVQLAAEAGRHETRLDVSGLSSGVYVLRVQAGGAARTQKVTVLQ